MSYPFLPSHPQHELAKRQMRTGGTVVAFEVAGGADATIAFIERCRLARIALSLGGPETLLTHPATIAGRYTPAERAELGITDGLVRMSVGLEHVDDLRADLAQALSPDVAAHRTGRPPPHLWSQSVAERSSSKSESVISARCPSGCLRSALPHSGTRGHRLRSASGDA